MPNRRLNSGLLRRPSEPWRHAFKQGRTMINLLHPDHPDYAPPKREPIRLDLSSKDVYRAGMWFAVILETALLVWIGWRIFVEW
jgi:hypothetical protein